MCPDDEFYEREVISTNKVYKLQEGDPPHLMAITEMCGYMPRICVLNTKEVWYLLLGVEAHSEQCFRTTFSRKGALLTGVKP